MKNGLLLGLIGSVLIATPVFGPGPGSAIAETLAAVQLEDARGKVIEIPQPVDSVAIFPLPLPEAMIAIDGGTERLKAINPLAQTTLMNGVIGQLFPEIADIDTSLVSRDFVPNVEEVLRASPDVVVQWNFNLGEVVEPMENAGVTVVTVDSNDREDRRAYIAMLGKILGKEERAQSFLDWDDEVFGEIAETLKAVPEAERKRIVFIDSMNGNEFIVFGTQEVYFDAGGLKNAATEAGFTDGSVTASAETLLEWNPDIIFVNYYDDRIKPKDILQHPVLSALDAVKAGRVYKTPAIDPATSAGGELTYHWFAEIGYPELFSLDVRKAVFEGFQRLYNRDLTDAQLDRILQMDWNGKSAGYVASFAKP